jgi:hypothetical protein
VQLASSNLGKLHPNLFFRCAQPGCNFTVLRRGQIYIADTWSAASARLWMPQVLYATMIAKQMIAFTGACFLAK